MDDLIGTILPWSVSWVPQNWLFCNGQSVSIQQYQALFALIGTSFGGDGSTNFQLPDLRGRIPVGSAMSTTPPPTVPNLAIGQQGGEQQVTLQSAQIPAHTHPLMVSSSAANANLPTGNLSIAAPNTGGGTPTSTNGFVNATPNTSLNLASVGYNTGAGMPHDNMQPYLTLNYIICWNGIYPQHP